MERWVGWGEMERLGSHMSHGMVDRYSADYEYEVCVCMRVCALECMCAVSNH